MRPGRRASSRMAIRLTVLASTILAPACSDPLAFPEEAEAAQRHLEKLLDNMEAHSINRKKIDWPVFRSTVLAAAPEPRDISETFGAIHIALGLLDDNHSSYVAPAAWNLVIVNWKSTCSASITRTHDFPTDIGYVRAEGFAGASTSTEAANYSRDMHNRIRNRDGFDPIGWVVDLRGNNGGNMWPMIAGLGPILGERTVGWFINPDGGEFNWEYRGGLSINSGTTMHAVASPYTLKQQDPKVAVLIDGAVVSSGEAAAIAFKGRPNTRFFGTPTCGKSTANVSFSVDDATLVLTVATMADRNKFAYGDTLRPDELITNEEELRDRAIEWIRESPGASAHAGHGTKIRGRSSGSDDTDLDKPTIRRALSR